nr:MAG TPA: hypothetical protein [Caudoviricetes sp.]
MNRLTGMLPSYLSQLPIHFHLYHSHTRKINSKAPYVRSERL